MDCLKESDANAQVDGLVSDVKEWVSISQIAPLRGRVQMPRYYVAVLQIEKDCTQFDQLQKYALLYFRTVFAMTVP